MGSETLHDEIAATSRAILEIARYEERADPDAPAPGEAVREAAAGGLRRLAGRRLPVELRKRLERIGKRLGARKEGQPRRDLGRELEELVDPLRRAGWAETLLGCSLAALPGIGPKRAEGLARRGLERISDLLFWLPVRYEDRRSVVSVDALEVGRSATFLAQVKLADWVPTRRKGGRFGRIFQAVVGDENAVVTLKWFRGGETLANQIVKGRWPLVSGEVRRYRSPRSWRRRSSTMSRGSPTRRRRSIAGS